MGPKKPVVNPAASHKGLNNNEGDDSLDVDKVPVPNLDIPLPKQALPGETTKTSPPKQKSLLRKFRIVKASSRVGPPITSASSYSEDESAGAQKEIDSRVMDEEKVYYCSLCNNKSSPKLFVNVVMLKSHLFDEHFSSHVKDGISKEAANSL